MFDLMNKNIRADGLKAAMTFDEPLAIELSPEDLQAVAGGKSFWKSGWGEALEAVGGATGIGGIATGVVKLCSSPRPTAPIGTTRTYQIENTAGNFKANRISQSQSVEEEGTDWFNLGEEAITDGEEITSCLTLF